MANRYFVDRGLAFEEYLVTGWVRVRVRVRVRVGVRVRVRVRFRVRVRRVPFLWLLAHAL